VPDVSNAEKSIKFNLITQSRISSISFVESECALSLWQRFTPSNLPDFKWISIGHTLVDAGDVI